MPTLDELVARSGDLASAPAWAGLGRHAVAMQSVPLRQLLDRPDRFAECSREGAGLLLDFSRQRVAAETLELLLELSRQRDLPAWIRALLGGEPVNNTEGRPALHSALRAAADEDIRAAGVPVMPEVIAERHKLLDFADVVRSGAYRGHTGRPITDVVNIGIGGSDLGLVMATDALAQYRHGAPACHFVSNIDGSQLADLCSRLDPASTLFVICSKSFTTLETRLNGQAARAWLVQALPEAAVARHFVAVSTNDPAMDAFGIDPGQRFRLWDWVGGRYSLWSSIGLAIAIAIGRSAFEDLLAGGAAMDAHFRDAELGDNLPVLLGLLGIWNQNFMGAASHVVLPYDQRLHRFPAFLQQLEMESNGKSVTRDGQPAAWGTGAVIWGEPGSNAQHSFFQLLHQGTARFSLDFIAPARASSSLANQHEHALANLLAQAEAFARGVAGPEVAEALRRAGKSPADIDRLAPHKVHPGNHPSSILLFRQLDPRTLGALIALYEHKVFVQSVIWGINAFDQWGVELGKTMATDMHARLSGPGDQGLPGIAGRIRAWRAG